MPVEPMRHPLNWSRLPRRPRKKIFFHILVILTSLRFFLWGGVHNQDAGAGLSQIDLEACEYQGSHKKINNVNICLQEDLFAFYYFSSKRHLNV